MCDDGKKEMLKIRRWRYYQSWCSAGWARDKELCARALPATHHHSRCCCHYHHHPLRFRRHRTRAAWRSPSSPSRRRSRTSAQRGRTAAHPDSSEGCGGSPPAWWRVRSRSLSPPLRWWMPWPGGHEYLGSCSVACSLRVRFHRDELFPCLPWGRDTPHSARTHAPTLNYILF